MPNTRRAFRISDMGQLRHSWSHMRLGRSAVESGRNRRSAIPLDPSQRLAYVQFLFLFSVRQRRIRRLLENDDIYDDIADEESMT